MLPEGKYVLFGRWDDDNSHYQTYGIFERFKFQLETTCERNKMYRCISVSDDKEMLETTLTELNNLNSELKEADEYKITIKKLKKIILK